VVTSPSLNRVRWLRVLMVVSVVALFPAFCFSPNTGGDPPPDTFPNYVTDSVDLTVMPSVVERVRVLTNRDYRRDKPPRSLAILIWLPFAVGLYGVFLLHATHDGIQVWYGVMTAGVAIGIACAVTALWRWPRVSLVLTVLAILMVVGLIFKYFPCSGISPDGRRLPRDYGIGFHMFTVALLAISGAAASATTHQLLTKYAGYAPATDRFKATADEFDRLMIVDAPAYVRDDAAWRMAQLPFVNAFSWHMTLFGFNRAVAVTFVLAIGSYIFVWAIVLHHHHRDRGWVCRQCSREYSAKESWCKRCNLIRAYSCRRIHRVLFAPIAYLAAGAAFAVIFYNDYAAAAAKQNVMATYADYLLANATRAKNLEDYFRTQGWSGSIEQEILQQARQRPGDRRALADSIDKARAQYWPSAVIAHETPRVRVSDAPPSPTFGTNEPPGVETEFAVDPIMSFHDMAYFSFVTFTTTGYGDVRPVSDGLRFWTIVENVMEILFVAMFLGVALGD
jgi:hypothetical protein